MIYDGLVKSDNEMARMGTKMDAGLFMDFGWARKNVVFRLVNRARNEELLKTAPSVNFLDLAVTFQVMVSLKRNAVATAQIRNEHMAAWKTDAEELFELAKRNAPRLLGWERRSVDELLSETFSSGSTGGGAPGVPLLVLTNRPRLYGASCLLYPGLLEALADELGGGCCVIPSSVHEALLAPVGLADDVSDMEAVIREVNATLVPPDEVLSDHLYVYSREKGELERA